MRLVPFFPLIHTIIIIRALTVTIAEGLIATCAAGYVIYHRNRGVPHIFQNDTPARYNSLLHLYRGVILEHAGKHPCFNSIFGPCIIYNIATKLHSYLDEYQNNL